MTEIQRLQQFVDINKRAHRIIDAAWEEYPNATLEDWAPWSDVYDMIFSDNISRAALGIVYFDWYDPDTTYYEDVMSFMSAFDEECEHIKKIIKIKKKVLENYV